MRVHEFVDARSSRGGRPPAARRGRPASRPDRGRWRRSARTARGCGCRPRPAAAPRRSVPPGRAPCTGRSRCPGTRPPMSMWWAIDPDQAISAPSRKSGVKTCRSGVWVPPMYGLLVRNASPGLTSSPHFSSTDSSANCISPSCAGICSELRDHPPVGGEQAAVEVEHLADDRRVRRAILDHRHLLGDVVERAGQDLLRDRVDRRGRHATPPPAPAQAWRRRRPGPASPPGRRSWRPPARRSSPARSPCQTAATRDGRAPSGGRRPRRRPHARRLPRSAPWRPRVRSSRSTGCGPGRGHAG